MDIITSFRDLEVWQLAMDLVDLVIADTRKILGSSSISRVKYGAP